MSIATFVRRSQQVISDNSPAILTGAAIAGTVVTTLLVGRAGFRAGYKVAVEDLHRNGMVSEIDRKAAQSGHLLDTRHPKAIFKERFHMTWKLYMAPTVTGIATITSIAFANRISTNRTAALAAAYTITDKAFTEYKSKVVETLGEKKEQTEIRDKIMQDRVDNSGERAALVIISNNDVLCYDAYTDRYFQSTMEKLKKAQNDTNYEILSSMYVSLSEFYSRIGLPPTQFSDEVGWNSEHLLELHFSSVMTPDDRPAIAFTFHVDPVRRYDKVHG